MQHESNTTNASGRWGERLREAVDDLWDRYIDARDAFADGDGSRWLPVGSPSPSGLGGAAPFTNEAQLTDIRAQCRALAVENEFAINGHENRISYIVGRGHSHHATPHLREPDDDSAETCRAVDDVLREFMERNRWRERQQEIVRRLDRDGEAFLRFFPSTDGGLDLRFVEPDQVRTPPHRMNDASATFGVQCDPRDAEAVQGYWIDDQWVDAAEIQHRKANVDSNVKRGLPLFYPVRKNLRRAEKLLRNMSVLAEIQSAIALIRKHGSGTANSIRRFVEETADASATDPGTGRAAHLHRYAPGTILDAFSGVDYEFPAAAIDAGSYVAVLRAELRAIAARLVMPEFMLTADASNGNYASTMVAEGPAVRMFQRLQHAMIERDRAVMRRAVEAAIASGRLPADTLARVRIDAIPPSLEVRDRYREARADAILVERGAMSVRTMALRHGLDPDEEQRSIREVGS